jgi:hypothetical protein
MSRMYMCITKNTYSWYYSIFVEKCLGKDIQNTNKGDIIKLSACNELIRSHWSDVVSAEQHTCTEQT